MGTIFFTTYKTASEPTVTHVTSRHLLGLAGNVASNPVGGAVDSCPALKCASTV